MDAFCLLVAGVVRALLPGPELGLEWQHSVAKTRWQERYALADGQLALVRASVEGAGAGMEAPPGALLADGAWTWRPGTRLPELVLTYSAYAEDYRICAPQDCRTLAAWIGPAADGAAVVVRPCATPR